jgi:cytochrome P450
VDDQGRGGVDDMGARYPRRVPVDTKNSVNGCPAHTLVGYNPVDPGQIADDAGWWARAHRDAPVFLWPETGMWAVTAHRDVLTVLKDTETFSSTAALNVQPPPAAAQGVLPQGYPWKHPALVSLDSPEHTRVRKQVSKAFTPRRVAQLEPVVRAAANDLVDKVERRGEMDVMGEYALPITMAALEAVLGVDPDRAAEFRQWTVDTLRLVAGGLSDEELAERALRVGDFDRYLRELMERRRAAPQDDLVSDMVGPDSDLGENDVVGNAASVLIAGNETTTSVIVHSLLYLLSEDRRLWVQLRDNRDLIPSVVEETIRLSGASRGLFRVTTREAELGGVTLPAGSMLHVLWAAANVDGSVFTDPAQFDLNREDRGAHVGFGRGTHFCVGASLARMEARVALEVLLDRLPDLALVPGRPLDYLPSLATRSLTHLQLQW